MKPQRVTPRGFTLIELLTVIAIIGVLAAIIIPVVGKMRTSAYATKSSSNLRQLQLANLAYAADHKGKFIKPHGAESSPNPNSDYSNQWVTNTDLKTYAGVDKLAVDWNDATKRIPIATSGFPTTQVNSIGYNDTDYNKLGSSGRAAPLRQTEIVNPGKHIAFAESSDWIIYYASRKNWNATNDTGSNALAYRAGDTTIVVTYGGNVQKLTKTETDDKARWIIDITKI